MIIRYPMKTNISGSGVVKFLATHNLNNPVVILRFVHPAIVPIEGAVLFELKEKAMVLTSYIVE